MLLNVEEIHRSVRRVIVVGGFTEDNRAHPAVLYPLVDFGLLTRQRGQVTGDGGGTDGSGVDDSGAIGECVNHLIRRGLRAPVLECPLIARVSFSYNYRSLFLRAFLPALPSIGLRREPLNIRHRQILLLH